MSRGNRTAGETGLPAAFSLIENQLDGTALSARVYGAVGDGSTDDSAALQAAIDAAYTAGGGTVQLEARTYVATGLQLKAAVILAGAGMHATILKLKAGSNGRLVSIYDNTTGGRKSQFAGLRDLTLDGNKANNTTGGVGVYANASSGTNVEAGDQDLHLTFSNLFLVRFKSHGFDINNGGMLGECRWINCQVYFCDGDAFRINADSFLVACTSGNNAGNGYSSAGWSHRLVGCKAFGSGYNGSNEIAAKAGFSFINVNGISIAGCEAQDNRGQGFYFEACTTGSVQGVADNNSAQNAGSYAGVDLWGSNRMNIQVACMDRHGNGWTTTYQKYTVALGNGSTENTLMLTQNGVNGATDVVYTKGGAKPGSVITNGTTINNYLLVNATVQTGTA